MTQEMGQWLEAHPELPTQIRAEEDMPEGTRVLVASLDGVNVLLAEPGVKRGRPAERPQGPEEVQESPTSYKNAMVGSVSWYGEVPEVDFYHATEHLSKAAEALFGKGSMDYRRFRLRGWPIGSGPVEAAAKTLVKVRMCRSGMRWSRPGGQHVLVLRTYLKSDRWDAMWQCYKAVSQTAA